MKHFLALPALLRPAVLLATASQHAFSVNDDLLAFPQYEVHFNDDYVHIHDAEEKLLHNDDKAAETDRSDIAAYRSNGAADSNDGARHEDEKKIETTYERMVLDGHDFLCAIPTVEPPTPHSQTRNETLAKVDKEKELARAVDRGWELLSGMQDNCIYFVSGWWSYRFCYGQGVKQFHQLPPNRGVPVYPPIEDPGVPGFELGLYKPKPKRATEDDDVPDTSTDLERRNNAYEDGSQKAASPPARGELVERGESRYLVQRLSGGTKCDLTGKDRKIEIQFHCHPQSADRISLIKETATCAYLMVIQTPRLCNDVAFLPPQKDHPNAIQCHPILRDDQIEEYERNLKAAQDAEKADNIERARDKLATAFGLGEAHADVQVAGDIVVGGHRRIPDGKKLEKGAIVGGGKETYVETIAASDGRLISEEDLKKLGLGDLKNIKKLKDELERYAKGLDWKLDVFDTPHGREYRGIVGDNLDEDEEEEDGAAQDGQADDVASTKKNKKKTKDHAGAKDGAPKKDTTKQSKTRAAPKTEPAAVHQDEPEAEDGSEEEYYKEEL